MPFEALGLILCGVLVVGVVMSIVRDVSDGDIPLASIVGKIAFIAIVVPGISVLSKIASEIPESSAIDDTAFDPWAGVGFDFLPLLSGAATVILTIVGVRYFYLFSRSNVENSGLTVIQNRIDDSKIPTTGVGDKVECDSCGASYRKGTFCLYCGQ